MVVISEDGVCLLSSASYYLSAIFFLALKGRWNASISVSILKIVMKHDLSMI